MQFLRHKTCNVFLIILCFLGNTSVLNSQNTSGFKKGSFYILWGYNRAFFTYSDIQFKGDDYNFSLRHVRANDRQSKLGVDPYLRINQLTIPQYNYRLGYCINEQYNISFGFDHMKYVMNQDQTVEVNGVIGDSYEKYKGNYDHKPMEMKGDFLEFEHTDGLNYLNFELNRIDPIFNIKGKLRFNVCNGFSLGIMYPRSRVVLLNRSVNDEWHLSGYGSSLNTGLQVSYGKHFFLQSKCKAGYINMPKIVTTGFKNDRAKQHFEFLQINLVLGYRFSLQEKKK